MVAIDGPFLPPCVACPSYEQKRFGEEEKRGRLRLIASPDGHDGSVTLHTDAKVYAGTSAVDEG